MADLEGNIMIELKDISKTYQMGTQTVHALRGIDLAIESGELVAIMGPSGSGKSTLMNIIGCLDLPTTGTYTLAGLAVSQMSDDEQAILQELAQGKSNREIAETLHLAEGTVKNYVSTIIGKLHANDRTQAAILALKRGLATLD